MPQPDSKVSTASENFERSSHLLNEARQLIDETTPNIHQSLIEKYQVEDIMSALDMAIDMVDALQTQLALKDTES
ncbi:hypothetical protein ACQ4M3_07620 [Leptolyngbya sp. AN03gr2]|uniref:hypothetical protein n=1 Tax=unclassified Leptolyngbya TaxID=2650499 RepID=UPI003D314A6B